MPRSKRSRSKPKPDTSSLLINVFDGSRQLFDAGDDILYRVLDGNQQPRFTGSRQSPSLRVNGLPFFDNFGDQYTAIVSVDDYQQAGFTPLLLSPDQLTSVDLMIIPNEPHFDFSTADWNTIKTKLPFLAAGVTAAAAETRYEALAEDRPRSLAGLFNITTAMGQIFLPTQTPLDYLKEMRWDDSLAEDRFFAYCDAAMVDQVRLAASHGEFEPEVNPAFFHPGATASWKQVQFGEANVQLTFHENDRKTIDGVPCVLVEPDIDYYKDLGAHALLEVIPSAITGGLSNPETVYVLRWIAGRHAGIPEFDPPFTIRA
jgi:hypothetical protein